MRTEPLALALVLALTSTGCVSSAVRDDLTRIERITARDLSAEVLGPVDAAIDAEIEALLEQPIDADDAARIALANNRELRATLRELGVARGRVLQASLLPNPEAEIDVREAEDGEQPVQVELFLGFELTHALLTPLRVEAASHELEAERQRAAGRVIATEYQARAAFHRAQAAEQRLAIGMRALDALAAARDAARMLFDAGGVPEVDVAAQIAAYEEARAVVSALELERALARERLGRVLGLHGESMGFVIDGALAPAEPPELPEALERTAIESSVELAELRSRALASGARIDLARVEGWLPEITIDVHGEQDGQSWELGGGASLSVPLFDHREGDVASEEAALDALMERYEGLAIDIRSAARELGNRVTTHALSARAHAEAIVPARRHALRQTVLAYDAMQVGIFALLDALRAVLSAELAEVDARREYWVARAALDALLRGHRVSDEASTEARFGAAGGASGGH